VEYDSIFDPRSQLLESLAVVGCAQKSQQQSIESLIPILVRGGVYLADVIILAPQTLVAERCVYFREMQSIGLGEVTPTGTQLGTCFQSVYDTLHLLHYSAL